MSRRVVLFALSLLAVGSGCPDRAIDAADYTWLHGTFVEQAPGSSSDFMTVSSFGDEGAYRRTYVDCDGAQVVAYEGMWEPGTDDGFAQIVPGGTPMTWPFGSDRLTTEVSFHRTDVEGQVDRIWRTSDNDNWEESYVAGEYCLVGECGSSRVVLCSEEEAS